MMFLLTVCCQHLSRVLEIHRQLVAMVPHLSSSNTVQSLSTTNHCLLINSVLCFIRAFRLMLCQDTTEIAHSACRWQKRVSWRDNLHEKVVNFAVGCVTRVYYSPLHCCKNLRSADNTRRTQAVLSARL